MTDLAYNIRRIRERQDLSLADLAEKSGVSRGYLHQIEKGHNSPTQDKVNRIAAALGVMVAELLGDIASVEDLNVPDCLKHFARANGLESGDVLMLSRIHWRGRYPQTEQEYAILWSVIKGTLG